ncbi:MAG: hypothetical protein JWP62_2000 [Blastococcus sp.]|nr:hypothetical protein [Blastococcus sp.]
MKLHLTRRSLAIVGTVAVLAGGGATVAAASASTPATGTAADEQQADGEHADGQDGGAGSDQEQQDPTYTGSVAAPAEQADAQEGSAGDSQEQAALQALATVSAADAEKAALAVVPGTVAETDLGNENGFVVYSVEVNGADGTVTEVTIDAGNASVLAQQVQDSSDPADGPDQAEQPGDQQD